MQYQSQQIIQGNRNKREAEENPNTFGTENGVTFNEPSGTLEQKNQTRMAGPMGAFALQLQNDPELAQRVAEWDQMFAQSNEGMQFNQAKLQIMGDGLMLGERQQNDMEKESRNDQTRR